MGNRTGKKRRKNKANFSSCGDGHSAARGFVRNEANLRVRVDALDPVGNRIAAAPPTAPPWGRYCVPAAMRV